MQFDISKWNDPYPKPYVEPTAIDHDRYINVVRDDKLGYGSKIRFLDALINAYPKIDKWVFGSCPATGYAQISLPAACSKYGKRTILFMAKRDPENYTDYQKKGIALGAEYHWVPDGMLNVTQARAREYAIVEPTRRMVLPLGLEHPVILQAIVKVAQAIDIKPKEVWTVGSSGTLSRGLQLAWPNANFNVVQVGHKMKPEQIGRAKLWVSPYKFDRPVKGDDIPPFPSAPTYDAKAWSFVKAYASSGALFWNVGA